MENRYKERLVTRQSIYIDSKRLLDWLYGVRWKVNRRDRAYLFDTLLIPYVLGGMKNREQEERRRFFVAKALWRFGKTLSWNGKKKCFCIKKV